MIVPSSPLTTNRAGWSRAGLLRGFGNAIVSTVAATFVQAVMQSLNIEPEGT